MRRSLSLGAKLNLALLVFLLLLGAATLAVMVTGFNRTQDSATERSRRALEEQGKLALQAVVGGASETGGGQFEAVAETGKRAALYMDSAAPGETTPFDTSRLARTAGGVYYDPAPDRTSDLVILNGESPDDPAVQDDIAFATSLDAVFPVLFEGFPGEVGGTNFDPIAIAFISTNGVARYYPAVGIQEVVPPTVDLAQRMAPVGPEQNPQRKTIWTAPYQDAAGQGQVVTADSPVYSGDAFRGMVQVDLSLDNLIDQVNGIHPTPGGFAFYVDTAGNLMRTDKYDLLSSEADTNADLAAVLEAMRSPEPLDENGDSTVTVETLTLNGEAFFVAHAPMLAIGGSFGAAAPVSEVTAQAAAITEGIEDEGNRTFVIMLIAMGSLFVVGLAGATYFNRRLVVQPVQKLAAATQAVAAGNLDTKVELPRGDEFGALAQSFNTMVEQLRESERLLERKVDERTRELDALLRADAELYRSLDLDEVLQTLCDVAVDVLSADKSLVSIWDEQRGQAFVRAARNFSAESVALLQDALMGAGHPGPANDFEAQFYEAGSIAAVSPQLRAIQEMEGIQATTDIPIRSPKGAVLGGFGVGYTEAHEFSDDERRLLIALAERAAVAIENADLYQKAQQAASLEERQRLARELHDSVSQALYGIALGARTARELLDRDPARAAEPVDYVLSLAEAGLAEMRALIFELRPESLEMEGLVEALRKQVAATQARFGIEIAAAYCDEPDAPVEVKEAFYRVGQEALHNIVKHAKATNVSVRLERVDSSVLLEVRDDGSGFDPEGDFAGHLGLRSMRERAAKAGGTLSITSVPGDGTTLKLQIPDTPGRPQ